MTHNTKEYHLLYNHQGSLRAVVDTEGTIIKELHYDSFGTITNDTNPTLHVTLGFAGGLYDEDSKLTRFGYRDYDAYTGKWTAKDAIGFAGGDANLYGYVLGDPVNFVDPTGKIFQLIIPAIPLAAAFLAGYEVGSSIRTWYERGVVTNERYIEGEELEELREEFMCMGSFDSRPRCKRIIKKTLENSSEQLKEGFEILEEGFNKRCSDEK